MNKIWHNRLYKYHKKIAGYLKYVFNDHFIIALFFIIGGLFYGYSVLLNKYLNHPNLESKILAIFFLYVLLNFTDFTTLLKKADMVFLLPRDYYIERYLNKALYYNMIISALVEIIFSLVIVPLLVHALQFTIVGWIVILIDQVVLKWDILCFSKIELFNSRLNKFFFHFLFKFLIPIIILIISILVNPKLGLIFSLIIFLMLYFGHFLFERNYFFNWNLSIQLEENRLYRIYRFLNFFIDIPEIHQKIKRYKYLDYFLPKYKKNKLQVYVFLYWRGFIRNVEYSGLFLRLLIVGTLLLLFIKLWWLDLFIGILFIYLFSFQIIPLFNSYYDIVFTHIYPLNFDIQKKSFKLIVSKLIIFQIIDYSITILISLHSFILFVTFIVFAFIISIFFMNLSFNKKINKLLDMTI